MSATSRLHPQPVRRHARRPGQAGQAVLLLRLRGSARAPGTHDHVRRARRQCPARPAARSGQPRSVPEHRREPRGRAVPERVSRSPNGPTLGDGTGALHASRSISASTSTSSRAASTTTSRPVHQLFARYTFDDAGPAAADSTTRSSRATSSRATSSSPASTAAGGLDRPAQHVPRRLQPDARRPGRGGQHRAAAVRGRPRAASATSTSAACSGSGPQSSATSASCSTCSACRPTPPGPRGRHLLKFGALAEHYQTGHGEPDVQPRDVFRSPTSARSWRTAPPASSA